MKQTPSHVPFSAVEIFNHETVSRWEEVKQGKTVSHQSVMEWLKTWETNNEIERPLCDGRGRLAG